MGTSIGPSDPEERNKGNTVRPRRLGGIRPRKRPGLSDRKRAADGGRELRFSIILRRERSNGSCRLTLVLGNSGPPFSEEVDLAQPEPLSLRLISALVEQLDGSIELARNPHPFFTIRFPEALAE
jgi:hypothetical protein